MVDQRWRKWKKRFQWSTVLNMIQCKIFVYCYRKLDECYWYPKQNLVEFFHPVWRQLVGALRSEIEYMAHNIKTRRPIISSDIYLELLDPFFIMDIIPCTIMHNTSDPANEKLHFLPCIRKKKCDLYVKSYVFSFFFWECIIACTYNNLYIHTCIYSCVNISLKEFYFVCSLSK